jgi:hypothetical protein
MGAAIHAATPMDTGAILAPTCMPTHVATFMPTYPPTFAPERPAKGASSA